MRHFGRGLVDNDLISPGADLGPSIAAILAAFVVLSAGVALTFLSKYNSVVFKPRPGFIPAQFQTLAEKLAMARDDKALLIGAAMIVMGLIVVVCWDALVLDDRDVAVLGPLPVRPSTMLAAKACAGTVAAAAAAIALTALPAFFFPIVVLLKTSLGPLDVLREMIAQGVAGIAGCGLVFLAFASLRTLAALFGRDGLVARLVPVAQFALVLVLLASLFALPELAGRTRATIDAGSGRLLLLPWVWFVGVGEAIAGRNSGVFAALSRTALTALAISAIVAVVLQLLLFRVRFHRAGARALSPRSRIARAIAWTSEHAGLWLVRDGRTRAMFFFSARTITRHPRHRLYLAASLGLGLAVACVTIAAAYGSGGGALKSMGLAAQLNLIFFVVVGLRAAAAVPADLDAGWTFRLLAVPARERYVAGTRAAIFAVIILPLLILLAPIHIWAWGPYTALVHFAFGIIAALGLLDVVFTDYRRMPFVSSFVPGGTIFAPLVVLYAFDYALFAYLTPAIEQLLIERTGLLYAWLALGAVAIGRLFAAQSTRLRRDHLPDFDHAEPDVQQLQLWDASHKRGDEASTAVRPSPALFQTFGTARIEPEPGPLAAGRARRLPQALRRLPADFGFAIRKLAAQPLFTVFSVAALAFGIAVTTGLYSVVYSTILRPLPVHDLDALVNVYHADPAQGNRFFNTLSLPDFVDFARVQHVFTAIAAHAPFGQIVIAGGTGVPTRGEIVTGRYFEVLGVRPLVGRLLLPSDDRAGARRVAVIDARMWRRRFNGTAGIVGTPITMAGQIYDVVGVAPPDFHGVELPNLAPTEIWIPMSGAADVDRGPAASDREWRWLGVKGRLATGRTIAEARADVRVIGAQLDLTHPIGVDLEPEVRSPPYVSRHWVARPARDRMVTEQTDPSMRRLAWLTMLATGLVLLVACTNLANLTLARAVSLRRDIAVRYALGASHWDVVREQLVEHAVVAALAALSAFAALRLFIAYGMNVTLRLGPWISIDPRPVLDVQTLIAGASATGVALVVSGLLPSLSLARGASLAAGAASTARWSGRRWLVASQVAVSVALVAIASLCARNIVTMASLDTGLALDRVAFAWFDFRVQGWPKERGAPFVERLVAHASGMSGVEAAAAVSGLPLKDLGRGVGLARLDRPFASANDSGTAVTQIAGTPALFRTLGIDLAAGRSFSASDTASSGRVVVLSAYAAKKLFSSTDVVGHQLLRRTWGTAEEPRRVDTLTIIGIAADTREESGQPVAAAYVPLSQQYEPSLKLVARTSGDPVAVASVLRTAARETDSTLGIIDAGTGAQLARTEAVAFQIMGALAGSLGTAAMALAMIGLYGVLSFVVAQRTREIGIRVALGATAARITRLVLGEGIRPVVEGLIVGFVIADLAEMALRPALQKPLPAIDGAMLLLVPVPFLVAAVIACYVPSRRAAAVDPSIALRQEA